MMTRTLTGLTALLMTLAANPARAGDRDEEARIQFQQGVELYGDNRFEQAAVAFARAYELKPSYKILFNIAQAENELGHYAAALEAYRGYVSGGGAEIEKARRTEVDREMKRLDALVGSIRLSCAAAGATVMVDGEVRGETPLKAPVLVDLGKHEVEVTRGGARLHRQIVPVAGGQEVVVKVEAIGASPVAIRPKAPVRRPEAKGKVAASAPPGPTPKGEGLDPLYFYLTLGAAGALGAGTLGLELAVQSTADDLEKNPSDKALVDKGKAMQTGERVLLGLTCAAAVATGVLAFFTDFGGDEAEVTPSAAVTDQGASVGLVGRF
ncbi:MAG: PEGA domain-containing protein [Deltaproteobacteria bacterium]|nr:PEGA domain-containing protein [Deltaproteobacteria bacterium]